MVAEQEAGICRVEDKRVSSEGGGKEHFFVHRYTPIGTPRIHMCVCTSAFGIGTASQATSDGRPHSKRLIPIDNTH